MNASPRQGPPPPFGPGHAGPPGGPPPPGPPPYGGPPGPYGGPPGPPRRRGRGCVVLLAVVALAAIVAGGVYYESGYKPRHYLRDWSQRIGAPQGNFSSGVVTGDNHTVTMEFIEQCGGPCSGDPIKAIADWVENDGGGSVDQGTVALCFHDGGSFDYDHGTHPVRIQCDRLTVQFTYRFTALLGY